MTTATTRVQELQASLERAQQVVAELKLQLKQAQAEAKAEAKVTTKVRATKAQAAKAKAVGTTPATVAKVEKAKAQTKAKTKAEPKAGSAADIRKRAKDLGLDLSHYNFRKKGDREAALDLIERSTKAPQPQATATVRTYKSTTTGKSVVSKRGSYNAQWREASVPTIQDKLAQLRG